MRDILKFLLELINLSALVKNLYTYRQLITTLTWRDFRMRYQGSFGGLFWSLFQPLVMMVIYTLVFSSFLKIKFGTSDSPFAFSVYLLCGMLPWTVFSEAISSSTGLIAGNANLVKRVVFPLEVLPLNAVLTNMIVFSIGLVLLIPMAWLLNGWLSWCLFFLPVIMLLQLLLCVGCAWIWTSFSVYFPDLRQFTGILLTIGMYLTPIFYPQELVPAWAEPIMQVNPFANLVKMYRQVIMNGVVPDWGQWGSLVGVAVVIFMLGYFWFIHTKKGFADIL